MDLDRKMLLELKVKSGLKLRFGTKLAACSFGILMVKFFRCNFQLVRLEPKSSDLISFESDKKMAWFQIIVTRVCPVTQVHLERISTDTD